MKRVTEAWGHLISVQKLLQWVHENFVRPIGIEDGSDEKVHNVQSAVEVNSDWDCGQFKWSTEIRGG